MSEDASGDKSQDNYSEISAKVGFLGLQNPKWLLFGPKMADGVWKGVYPKVLGRSRQLL